MFNIFKKAGKHETEKRTESHKRMQKASIAGNLDECMLILNECDSDEASRGWLGNVALCELLLYNHNSTNTYKNPKRRDTWLVAMLLNNGANPTFQYVRESYPSQYGHHALSMGAVMDTVSMDSWMMILRACASKWSNSNMMKIIIETLNVSTTVFDVMKLQGVFSECISHLASAEKDCVLMDIVINAIGHDNLTCVKLIFEVVSKSALVPIIEKALKEAMRRHKTYIIRYLLEHASRECQEHFQPVLFNVLTFVLKSNDLKHTDYCVHYIATILQANCDVTNVDLSFVALKQNSEQITRQEVMICQMLHSLGSNVLSQMDLTDEDLSPVLQDADERAMVLNLPNQPLKLEEMCRKILRQNMGRKYLSMVPDLFVIQKIKDYLMLREWGGLL